MGVEHALPEVPKGGVDRELVGHVDGLPLVYGVGAQVRIKLTITEDTTRQAPFSPSFFRVYTYRAHVVEVDRMVGDLSYHPPSRRLLPLGGRGMGGWGGTVHFKKRGIEWRRYIFFFTLPMRNVRARAGVGACRFGAVIPGGAEFPVLLQPSFPHIRLSQPTKGPPRRFEGAQP